MRPNYFIFIGYLKTSDREGVRANPSGSATAVSMKKYTAGKKKKVDSDQLAYEEATLLSKEDIFPISRTWVNATSVVNTIFLRAL